MLKGLFSILRFLQHTTLLVTYIFSGPLPFSAEEVEAAFKRLRTERGACDADFDTCKGALLGVLSDFGLTAPQLAAADTAATRIRDAAMGRMTPAPPHCARAAVNGRMGARSASGLESIFAYCDTVVQKTTRVAPPHHTQMQLVLDQAVSASAHAPIHQKEPRGDCADDGRVRERNLYYNFAPKKRTSSGQLQGTAGQRIRA